MAPVITTVTHRPLTLTMRHPFVTAHGHKAISRNVVIHIRSSQEFQAVAEASSSLAWPEQTPAAMVRCITRLTPRLLGYPVTQAWRIVREAWDAPWACPSALGALECALAMLEARAARQPLWQYLAARLGIHRRRPQTIHTSLTISAWPPVEADRVARHAASKGFRRLKVKVTGRDPDMDLARLLAVHRAAPPVKLVVDANQGFSALGAVTFARAMRRLHLPVIVFEQPVPRDDLEGLMRLTREAGVAIAADEAVCRPSDARRILRRRAAHVINVKLAKSGVQGAGDIIRTGRRAGVSLMIGCMAESAMGLTPSVHLACGSGAFTYVDLDSHLLVRNPRQPPAGFRTRGSALLVHHG